MTRFMQNTRIELCDAQAKRVLKEAHSKITEEKIARHTGTPYLKASMEAYLSKLEVTFSLEDTKSTL